MREKTSDGKEGGLFTERWDVRGNNPDGYSRLPSDCRAADAIDCHLWLYEHCATHGTNPAGETLGVTGQKTIGGE